MVDPVYFRRLPVPRNETFEQTRLRLDTQVSISDRQRKDAKARALAEGFPGVTIDTPVDPPFATWDGADVCPIHRFLIVEHERSAAQIDSPERQARVDELAPPPKALCLIAAG